jgi:hypothetical protein
MTANDSTGLKLIAFDAEDLAVVAAHLQDAVFNVGELAYLAGEKRFAAIANRFDWAHAQANAASGGASFRRRRAGIRFERVLAAQLTGFDLKDSSRMLNLLTMQFEQTGDPEGYVTLSFSDGAAIRLRVECIEAELKDLGAAWSTKKMPQHPKCETGSD